MLAGSREKLQLEKLVATIRNTSNHKIDLIQFVERVNDDRPSTENPPVVTGYGFRAWKVLRRKLSKLGPGDALTSQIAFEPSEARQVALLLTRACVDDDKTLAGKKIRESRLVMSYDRDKGDWKGQWEEEMSMLGEDRAREELEEEFTKDLKKPKNADEAEIELSKLRGDVFMWLNKHSDELPMSLYRLLIRCSHMREWCNELGEEVDAIYARGVASAAAAAAKKPGRKTK